MNNAKPSFAKLVAAALLLASCGKQDDRHAADADAKTTPAKAPPNIPSQAPSVTRTVPGQSSTPDASHTAPQARKRVMAEIVSMIGKPAGGLTRDHWKQIRGRYWLPSFNRVIRATGSAATIHELLQPPKDKRPLVVQLLSGAFETQDVAEQDSLLALHNLALVTAAAGGASLPAALADRQSDPNITQGDVILFEVFNDAFEDVPRAEQLGRSTLQEWKQMADSPNGVVRLLALRTFRRVAPQPEQWLEFYRTYKNERDEGILTELTDMVFETAKPEAATILGEIRSRPGQALPADLVAKLDRSIDFLTKLASQTQ